MSPCTIPHHQLNNKTNKSNYKVDVQKMISPITHHHHSYLSDYALCRQHNCHNNSNKSNIVYQKIPKSSSFHFFINSQFYLTILTLFIILSSISTITSADLDNAVKRNNYENNDKADKINGKYDINNINKDSLDRNNKGINEKINENIESIENIKGIKKEKVFLIKDEADNDHKVNDLANEKNVFNDDIKSNIKNLKEFKNKGDTRDHIKQNNQNQVNNINHEDVPVDTKFADDTFYNHFDNKQPSNTYFTDNNNNIDSNNNNNIDSNNIASKKKNKIIAPFVDPNVRKDVEFNYGVSYYALRASADSRFLIRYSPKFAVGTPWPRPQFYNTSKAVYRIDPDIEIITHLPQSHKTRAKRSFKDFDNNPEDSHEFKGNLQSNSDKDNGELKYVPLNIKPHKPKRGKLPEKEDDDFDMECSALRESIKRIRTITFGGRWDPEEGLVDGDDDDGDGEKEGGVKDNGGDWEWNGGKKMKKIMLTLTKGVVLKKMEITIEKPCQYYPHLDMDESYTLKVNKDGVWLRSKEIWGAVKGLETFSQLVYRIEGDSQMYFINRTTIRDFPRFKHRGVLLDTSRHYLDLSTILENLETMAQNKFNVFHWHIVDDQSFPYQSSSYPNLSTFGAFNAKTHIYTHEDIQVIIEEARIRGIRVIPEFDTPGHTFSWGFGQEHLLTPCYNYYGVFNGLFGPINPILKKTYRFLQGLFKEVMGVFKDKYIHFGGDEVPFDCWLSNLQIKNFMLKNKIEDIKQVLSFYTRQLFQLIQINSKAIKRKTGSIVWQEMFDNDIQLPLDTIIQVWSGDSYDLQRVISAGYGALFSTCWYLDYIAYGQDWDKYYTCDHIANLEVSNEALFYGGEVCLWTEYTDDANILSRLWPRASAAAERLWSHKSVNNVYKAAPRLEQHRCRMMNRGLQVGVLSGPSHCPRYRRKYKGKYSKHKNHKANNKNHLNKQVMNGGGVVDDVIKPLHTNQHKFSFDFVDDSNTNYKKSSDTFRGSFLYVSVSVLVAVFLLLFIKKFLKVPMRHYRMLFVLIILVVIAFIGLHPSNNHSPHVQAPMS